MAVSIPLQAVLRWGKAECGIQVQAGEAEEMTTVREQSDFSSSSLLFQNAGLVAQRFSIHSFHAVTSPHIAGQMYRWEKHALVK